MKNIADEIRNFLEATGITQAALASASGVPSSTICNLVKGKRKNVLGNNQDALRASMAKLAESNNASHTLADCPTPSHPHCKKGED